MLPAACHAGDACYLLCTCLPRISCHALSALVVTILPDPLPPPPHHELLHMVLTSETVLRFLRGNHTLRIKVPPPSRYRSHTSTSLSCCSSFPWGCWPTDWTPSCAKASVQASSFQCSLCSSSLSSRLSCWDCRFAFLTPPPSTPPPSTRPTPPHFITQTDRQTDK